MVGVGLAGWYKSAPISVNRCDILRRVNSEPINCCNPFPFQIKLYCRVCAYFKENIMENKNQTPHEFLSEFIELYRSFPCVWKVKSAEYSDRNKKDLAYTELVNI